MFAMRAFPKASNALAVAVAIVWTLDCSGAGPEPIRCRSWNDTAPKAAIVAFVEKVTEHGSADFVPESERIAVFDNDGTLWVEHPM